MILKRLALAAAVLFTLLGPTDSQVNSPQSGVNDACGVSGVDPNNPNNCLAGVGDGGVSVGGGTSPDTPAVELNFAGGTTSGCASLAACLSLTRTTQETCEPAGGTITYATSGNLCVTSEGVQVYGAGTNIVPQSQAVTGWSATNTTFTAGAAGTAPDATNAALVITDSAVSNVHGVNSANLAITGAQTYAVTVFVKAGTCAQASPECHIGSIAGAGALANSWIYFDASNCTVIGGTTATIKIMPPKALANGWCRIGFLTSGVSTTNGTMSVYMIPGASVGSAKNVTYVGAGSTMLIWGLDIKASAIFLPYCPTAGASATCNADVVAASGALKTALEGAALRVVIKTAELAESQPVASQTLLGVGSALTGLGVSAGYQQQSNWPTTATLKSSGLVIRYTNANWFGLSANASGRSMAMNGQTAQTDTNGLSASASEFLGSLSSATAFCNCVIADLKVWNTRSDAVMLAATANASALPLITQYTGAVANHTRVSQALIAAATATQAMARSHHRATENITSLSIRFPNYYVQNNTTETEIGPGAATTITASVEFPSGTCTALTFSAGSSGSIPNIGTLFADTLTIAIPAGSDFWIRDFRTNASGIITQSSGGGYQDLTNGEAMATGTTGVVDSTTTCAAVSNTTSNSQYYPDIIAGPTRLHTYCLLGDSRTLGFDDAISSSLDDTGEIERWIVPYYSVLNMGAGGDQAQKFIASHTNRLPMLNYCSGMLVNLGVNDVFTGTRTAAQIEADLQTIYAFKSNLNGGTGPVWQTTVMSKTTSSDNWTTTGNQATVVGFATINTLNGWIRANTAAITGFFENANAVSSAQDSDIWCANGATTFGCSRDGLHASQNGYLLQMNAHPFPTLN